MQVYLLALLIFLFPQNMSIQHFALEELESRLKTTPLNKQAGLLNDLAEAYLTKEARKALAYARQALDRARSQQNTQEEARALINLGEASLSSGKYDDALKLGESSTEIAKNYGYKPLLARALNLTGKAYRALGDKAKALNAHEQALRVSEESGDKRRIADSLGQLAIVYRSLNDVTRSLETQLKALRLREEIGDKQGIAQSLNSLGIIYRNQGEIAKAVAAYQRGLSLNEELGDKVGSANTLNNLGLLYNNVGENAQAVGYYLRSLRVREELGDQPGMAATLNNIVAIYGELNDHQKALEYARQALRLSEAIGDKRAIASASINLGLVYANLSEQAKGLEFHHRALRIWEELKDKQNIAVCWNNIGFAYQQLNRDEQALEAQLKAVRLWEELGNQRGLAASLDNLGVIYRHLGQHAKSLDYLQQALKMAEASGAKAIMRSTYVDLTETYAAMKDFEKALAAHRQAIEINEKLAGEDVNRRVAEIEKRSDLEKKEKDLELKGKEIELLRRNDQIQELRLAHQRDSIQDLERERALQRLSINAKEKEVDRLARNRQIQDLELGQSRNAAEKQSRQIELLQKNAVLQSVIRKSLLGAFASALLLATALAYGYRLNKKSARRLEEKNTEILRQKEILEQQAQEIERANHELKEATLTDPLTGMRNRRFYQLVIVNEMARMRRALRHLTPEEIEHRPNQDVLFYLLDIDHFKNINDQYGHEAGDQALIEVARRLDQVVRESDFVMRWGGEEFLVVARENNRAGGGTFAERILNLVGAEPITLADGRQIQITLSAGWAPYPFAPQETIQTTQEDVIRLADRALYLAKEAGRNRAIGLLPCAKDTVDVSDAENLIMENGQTMQLIYTSGPPPQSRAVAVGLPTNPTF